MTGGLTWNEGKYLFWMKSSKNPSLEFKHLLWKEILRMHFTSIGACRKCVFVMRLSLIYYIMIFLFNRANHLSMLLSQLLQVTLLIVRKLHTKIDIGLIFSCVKCYSLMTPTKMREGEGNEVLVDFVDSYGWLFGIICKVL